VGHDRQEVISNVTWSPINVFEKGTPNLILSKNKNTKTPKTYNRR